MATRTAAERRADERVAYDAYLKDCPTSQLLDRISDKWVSLILSALREQGTMRYSDLGRKIPGVSQKMLTQTLRSLERDGLLTRTVTPSVPVMVTYELTDLGFSLHQLMIGVKSWAEAHMDEVHTNRERYDQLSAAES